jgi:hypothetical protein
MMGRVALVADELREGRLAAPIREPALRTRGYHVFAISVRHGSCVRSVEFDITGWMRRMPYETIEVTKLTPHIGAEIGGVDLSRPLGNQKFQGVHDALMQNLVIFFREQNLTPTSTKILPGASAGWRSIPCWGWAIRKSR